MATNYTDQYTELVQQSQEAVRTAADNWTKTVQQAMGQLPANAAAFAAPYDVNTAIDQFFDLAKKLLEAQRDFSKNLVATSTAAGEAFAARAKEAAEAATEATKPATQAATENS
jgi:hypothetical protein